VFIEGHLQNTAPAGVTIDVLGAITAPIAYVYADGNNDTVNLARGLDTTPTIVFALLHNDTVNVRAVGGPMTINSLVGPTTINVSSTAGLPGNPPGVVNGIVGPVTVNGSGLDTLNVSDTASTANKAGFLTDTRLTGLGMGQGITYHGLRNLNVYLGAGDDTFAINEINPPTATLVDGGPGDNRVTATFQQDFQGDLTLIDFESGTVQVGRDLVGRMRDLAPGGNLQSVNVGRSVAASGQFLAQGNVTTLTVGQIVDTLTAGQDVAGHVEVDGNLDTAWILGSVLSTTGSTILVGHNLGRLTVGRVVNNEPWFGDVTGLITVLENFDTGYVYGSVSGRIDVSANLTSLLKVFGDVSGAVRVTGYVAELAILGSQSGSFDAGGYVTLLEIGAALTATGTVRVGGDLWSLRTGTDWTRPDHGLFGQVVVAGNFDQLRVEGAMTGTLAVGGDVGQRVVGAGGQVAHYGGIVVNGLFSGQIVAMGNVYGDLWFKSDVTTGRIAVRGAPVPGPDGGQLSGILGDLRVDGQIGPDAAIVSGGALGDAAGGTALRVGDVAGILAAEGAISYGAVGDLSAASIFDQAQGPDAAAIDAVFTDGGQALVIDPSPQGLQDLARLLAQLRALRVDGNGNLTGPVP
jgi:hypothetical protein